MRFLPYICFFFVDIVLLMIAVPNGKCKFISYNFLVMETNIVTQANYSLKEKYFRIEPEMRIYRSQYFVRVFILWILSFLYSHFSIFSLAILTHLVLAMPLGWLGITIYLWVMLGYSILLLLFNFLIYKMLLNLIIKRCHDLGSDGKIAQIIVTTIFIVFTLMTVIALISPYSIYIGSYFYAFAFSPYSSILQFIIWIPISLLLILLLLYPGVSGDNIYGKDPVNTKVGFLG